MMALSEAARMINGTLQGQDVTFTGVSTDTRTIQPGDLFIALKGERFDGHLFLRQAAEKGAVAAMVSDASAFADDMPGILVADTRLGLGELAAYWRSWFDIPLIAVTGSNGKTTVKEMIASILSAAAGRENVLATQGNLNNDIGMPLTLLKLRSNHRYAVIEMGMNHPGEISYLSAIAQPDVAIINNAHAAHLEGLKSVEGVARAKGEIYEGLMTDGVAVINSDDPSAPLWRDLAAGHNILEFGVESAADVTAEYELGPLGGTMKIHSASGDIEARLKVPGLHNVRNALAAATVAIALDVEDVFISQGLENFSGVKGRLQRKNGLHGAMLIDDTYNANPQSVRAAIDVLASAGGKKILVLGDMGELGENTWDLHGEIGAYAREKGIDQLFALGHESRNAVEKFGKGAWFFERIQELLADLENQLGPDVTVLIKGSRFMEMERVVKSFEAGGA